jgi:hypothetical protein
MFLILLKSDNFFVTKAQKVAKLKIETEIEIENEVNLNLHLVMKMSQHIMNFLTSDIEQ